ncbi:hypothetical protein EJ04DRAFT_389929, partial [Polyplosphaeria fusca]
LFFLAGQVVSTAYPTLQWDPDTVKDCAEWYNNDEGKTCEYVRKYFGITPTEFHTWNPSVSLDCKPWDWQSYCIITETKINATKPTTSSSSSRKPSSTTTVVTLGPSPTTWTDLGCYVEDSKMPILDKNMDPNGNTALTIPKCKNRCYQGAFAFAGVQKGNQCWCGSYVGGEWASNQTRCDSPCTGDKNTFCGGNGFVNVFEAEENQLQVSSTSVGVKTTSRASSVKGS